MRLFSKIALFKNKYLLALLLPLTVQALTKKEHARYVAYIKVIYYESYFWHGPNSYSYKYNSKCRQLIRKALAKIGEPYSYTLIESILKNKRQIIDEFNTAIRTQIITAD